LLVTKATRSRFVRSAELFAGREFRGTNGARGFGPRLKPVNIDPETVAGPTQERSLWREGESEVMRIVLIFLLLCSPALAHDPGHPELNEWFNRLTSGRGLCCSFADCFAVSDVDWESKDGHYRVRLENMWINVPDDALITEPNRVGRTMVWPLRFEGQILIRCFMPGSMG
jgi:hypothetical protein